MNPLSKSQISLALLLGLLLPGALATASQPKVQGN